MNKIRKKMMMVDKKSKQILATIMMGLNVVNNIAPLPMVFAMEKLSEQSKFSVKLTKSEAKPLEYTVLPQSLHFIENLIWGRAEAALYRISSGQSVNVDKMTANDKMHVSSGGTGLIGTMLPPSLSAAAEQMISSGGKGIINVMSGGYQYCFTETDGIVSVMSGGTQFAYGGSVVVSNMEGGEQSISSGIGRVDVMKNGSQGIRYSGCSGTINIMEGGKQFIRGGKGTIDVMNGGEQSVEIKNGVGIVNTLNNGEQNIAGTCSGIVGVMNGGEQFISFDGSGLISTMGGGTQIVRGDGANGTLDIMNNGEQIVSYGAAAVINTMKNGVQSVREKAVGKINVMSGGRQIAGNQGTAIIGTMNDGLQGGSSQDVLMVETMAGGTQYISCGAIGTVSMMNGGTQYLVGRRLSFEPYDTIGTVKTMNDGLQYISSRAIGSVNVLYGGRQQVVDGGTGKVDAMSGGVQYIFSGGTALDTTVYGGTQYISRSGIASNTIITGGTQLILEGGSAVNTTLNSGVAEMVFDTAVVRDLTMTGGKYFMGMQGNYKISGKFKFTGGIFDMTESSIGVVTGGVYDKLTIDNLQQGGGTFFMDTDLASETNSDKLEITNAEAGSTYYVQVKDTSLRNNTQITGEKKLLLITDASKNAIFIGKDLNNGGLWTVTPEIENGLNVKDAAGNVIGSKEEWYLTHVERAVNNDTEVLLDGTDNSYALWRNTNDTLRKRLGDLHYRTNEIDGDGIWARYTGGKFGGSGFDSSYNMYQLGYDKADNAKSTYGFAVESGTGHADYSFGSGKDKLFSGSFYGTWTGDDGSYTDVVAKIGQFDADIKSYGDYPDKASYKNRAYSVSVEYGKTIEVNEKSGTFIEPQLQFIAGRLSSSEYTTDRGNNVYIGGLNSYIGRVGFVAGQKTKDGNDVYFKASALHEFGGSRDIHMEAANGETLSMSKDYSDTWFEVGIGTNIKLSKASYFYGDIERSFGGEIEKKWQVNAGVRFSF